jgi:WD40 repeat protein
MAAYHFESRGLSSALLEKHNPEIPKRHIFHPDGKSFFVSHWADGSVGQYDTATGSLTPTVRLGSHPTDMAWRGGGPPEAGEAETRVGGAAVRGRGQYQAASV